MSARASQRQAGTNNDEVTTGTGRGDNKLVISQQDHIRIKYWHCHRLLTHHPAAFNPQQLRTRQFGAGGRGDKIRRILPIMEWEGVYSEVHSTRVQHVTGDRYRWLIPTSCPSPATVGGREEITRPPPAASDNEYDGAIFIRSHMSITDVRPGCQL